ncbi:YccF domain-containing protein [Lonepinella sp. BR2474]|uniref:YccF domain-containing protein n=1 Tax=Lonepinella sp. BR2474 TaxID=3434548 RepID=UPI003F6E3F71
MRALANVLWHIPFLGFLDALFCFFIGSILTITVVGAPIGLGLIQYSKFLLLPFKYEMIKKSDTDLESNKAWKLYGFLLKIIYVPFIGLPLLLISIIQIIALIFSIIGIPCAIVLAKSLSTIFQPVEKICVPRLVANAIHQHNAEEQMKKYIKEK